MPKIYPIEPIKVPRFEEASGFYTSQERSKIMSSIRAKNTKAEMLLRRMLWKAGIRYRINSRSLPGRPDISNIRFRFTVFIDGEFWHGHDWDEKKKKIKSNRNFWIPKIERNIQRDQMNNRKLLEMGFVVFRFWEKQVYKNPAGCVKQILDYLEITRDDG